jgi:hypothetical protein
MLSIFKILTAINRGESRESGGDGEWIGVCGDGDGGCGFRPPALAQLPLFNHRRLVMIVDPSIPINALTTTLFPSFITIAPFSIFPSSLPHHFY